MMEGDVFLLDTLRECASFIIKEQCALKVIVPVHNRTLTLSKECDSGQTSRELFQKPCANVILFQLQK